MKAMLFLFRGSLLQWIVYNNFITLRFLYSTTLILCWPRSLIQKQRKHFSALLQPIRNFSIAITEISHPYIVTAYKLLYTSACIIEAWYIFISKVQFTFSNTWLNFSRVCIIYSDHLLSIVLLPITS